LPPEILLETDQKTWFDIEELKLAIARAEQRWMVAG